MNLNKRTLFIIVPAIATFFIIASGVVYQAQKVQIQTLERNRLKLALAELNSLFNQYNSFAESYQYTIAESESVKRYLRESDNRYRRVALVRNIENNLQNSKKNRSDYLSLTIATSLPQKRIVEYIEFSEEPFALIPEKLKQRAYQIIPDATFPVNDIIITEDRTILAFSLLLDPNTLDEPLETQRQHAFSLTFAIEPTRFLSELSRYRREFDSNIYIAKQLPEKKHRNDFEYIELDDNSYLIAPIELSSLNKHLHPTKLKLTGISLFFIVSCTLLVFLLINRQITRPIQQLQKTIRHAKENKTEKLNIQHSRDDEIGSLANEFSELYSQLSSAYLKSNQQLKTDHLTQLANLYELKHEFHRRLIASRNNNETAMFLYLDLDNFKFVNDRYGHDIGDKILIAFSEAITKLLKAYSVKEPGFSDSWVFGRIAGDEFGIILSNSPSDIMVTNLLQDMLALFNGGFSLFNGKYPISTSIGVSAFPKDGLTPSELISNADTAMYSSKRQGKNRISHYSEKIAHKLRRERDVENELKNANFDNDFHLVYLPIVDCQTLQIWGFEALVRWNSKALGPVSPAEFIPIAEACGHFEAIDAWVLDKALASYEQIKQTINHKFILSVNLSSAQIALNRVQAEIFKLAECYDINPELIQFEMTETSGASFNHGTEGLLKTICDAGFNLAIDDFGTGHTAIQQLVEYPASTIKFDKSFLDSVMSDGRRKILKPLLELCHSQDMLVTVEGVETREQYEYLRSIGADHLQGYLFCHPVTIEALPGALISFDKKRQGLLKINS